jgi:hypothetical protein
MEYDALTIDTQTVEHNGFDFGGGLLVQLCQFANGPTEVIMSQIVVSAISKSKSVRQRTRLKKRRKKPLTSD